MSNVYASRADLYRYGLPRGMLTNPGRVCASVSTSGDYFELDGHGFVTDDAVLFRAEAGGALPAPIVAGTTYYAIPVSDQTFQVAAAKAGAPINLTTDGTNVLVATVLPFDDVLEFYSRFVDSLLPGHLVPLQSPYPITVTALVAELSAAKILTLTGQSSQGMAQLELAAKAQLERFGRGATLRDGRATHSANLAYAESVDAPTTRNWESPSTSYSPLTGARSGSGKGFLP